MRVVFADTCFWIALANPGDDLHAKAKELYASLVTARIVTTELVFVEFLNYASERGSKARDDATALIRQVESAANCDVIPHSTMRYKQAMKRYEQYNDKGWSLTDCDSMLAMRSVGTKEILTYDHHFEQDGCIALLRN